MNVYEVFTDGGARGNPGPSACAVVIKKEDRLLHKESKVIGTSTNNVAEYNGLRLAVGWLTQNLTDPDAAVIFHLDSELVVKQMNNLYKIKDSKLKILSDEIKAELKQLKVNYKFVHIPRNKNEMADELLNKALDSL